jgi:type VI secretion system secreted protein VgrG
MAQTDVHFSFEPACNSSDDVQEHVAFDVVEFKLTEALNEPFVLEVELLSSDANVDFSKLLDQPTLFTIWQGQTAVRHVHGLISDFVQKDTGFRRTRYRAVVEPVLARTRLYSDWEIFQQQSVSEIVGEVLKADHVDNYHLNAQQPHLNREYCVQADESDFAFIQRLLAEEAFVYRFEHSEQNHQLLITDVIQAFGSLSGTGETDGQEENDQQVQPVLYQPNPAGDRPQPALRTFAYQEKVRTARQTQRDYTFKNPRYDQQQASIGKDMPAQSSEYERYDYPGRYKQDSAGVPFTRTRLQSLRRDAKTAIASGDDARIQPGVAFELTGHPRNDLNTFWRPVRVEHKGQQHTSGEEEAANAQVSTRYQQTAELVPATAEWKAPIPPKPHLHGPEMAHVVGPEGEEIYTDEYGRVKVQFPWDRIGSNDEHSTCWIRVAQNWAGAGWGHMAIPRIGQEVIVDFLDGDPDQPIITGRTYDAAHPTPYKLPALKTQQTVKSKEHKGQGYNELLIDDTTGEIKTQLHSTHAATQLNIGYLTHPRDTEGNGEPRGEGFELRTDASGAMRAAKGLYISTNGRMDAIGGQLDITELKDCIATLESMVKGLLDTANEHEAPSATHDEREELIEAVNLLGAGANDREDENGAEPVIALSSPAGIAAATPQSIFIGAGRSLELAAQKDAHITINQQLHMTSGGAMSIFAATGGIKEIANQGDLHMQAQNGTLIGESKEALRLATAGHMTLVAKERLTLTCGGSYMTLTESGIEIGGPKLDIKAPINASGPASYSEEVNTWSDVKFDQHVRIMNGSEPVANYKYEIIRADGSVQSGVSDANGWTELQKSEIPEDFAIRLIGPAEGR